jgi:pilus assembly protein Flp/PilA
VVTAESTVAIAAARPGDHFLYKSEKIIAHNMSSEVNHLEHVMITIVRFLRDETAATSIEYAVVASGIALAIIVTVNSLGGVVKGKFTSVSSALN